jgi:acyl-CoA reductase-like NAD-dependent aldehyde dehydrogenase
LAPRALPLSPAAREKWIVFQHETERELAPGARLEPIRGLGNRLPAHAARLAAVLTLFEDVEATEVAAAAMDCGIELARYYAGEALRIVGAERVKPELRQAEMVRRWLLET